MVNIFWDGFHFFEPFHISYSISIPLNCQLPDRKISGELWCLEAMWPTPATAYYLLCVTNQEAVGSLISFSAHLLSAVSPLGTRLPEWSVALFRPAPEPR